MKSSTLRSLRSLDVWGLVLCLLAMQFVLACGGAGGGRKLAIVSKTPAGFTITETARPKIGLRSDFDDARAALAAGQHDRAIELFTAIADAESHFAAPHINLGIAHREAGNLEEAEAALLRALEANPRHPVAHNEIGIVYRRLGKFEEARSSYESALEIFENFHFARKNLAIVCDLFLEDLACALENYETYRAAVPDDEEVEMWVADVTQRMQR
jgi:tetratricopeptide (TPR) repeat protein